MKIFEETDLKIAKKIQIKADSGYQGIKKNILKVKLLTKNLEKVNSLKNRKNSIRNCLKNELSSSILIENVSVFASPKRPIEID